MEHVLWSGGTHSTAAIVELLRNNVAVHAHHIRMGVYQHRAEAELLAVQSLAPRLYACVPGLFGYTVKTVDFANDAETIARCPDDLILHRSKVLGFVADVLGYRSYKLGRAVPVFFGDYKGVLQYPAKGRIPELPKSWEEIVCDCLSPVLKRNPVGVAIAWQPCGKCERCGHAVR